MSTEKILYHRVGQIEKKQSQKQLNWTKPEAEINILIFKSKVVTKAFPFSRHWV